MEPCLDTKVPAFEAPTERADRMILWLLKIQPIDVEFSNISLNISEGMVTRRKKTVLKGVSGHFNSGELTAIMGPSGAGKSSLLRVLTGFITKGVKGSIKYNGTDLGSKTGKKETCFIMQEDHLAPLFTVYEIMTISANLKLGQSLSDKAKQLLVEDILDMMGLTKCRETRCNKLSGGQMKRLSIALELIDNPPVMFLDEPTTGLDSVSSLQCAKVLKALARGGRTIVCTIHQPCASIIDLFDHVYILREGQCVFQGASYNMLPYLKQFGVECPKYHNPADFLMEVVCGEYGSYHTQLIEAAKDDIWRKSRHLPAIEPVEEFGGPESKKEVEKTVVPIQPPGECQRLCILIKSYYTQLYRDWTISHLKVLVHILVGGLLGGIYLDGGNNGARTISNLSYLFVCVMYLSYTTMLPAITRFPLERDIVVKEHFNNWYKLKTYYFAITVSSFPVQLFSCTVHISVSYLLSAQPLEWQRFAMVLLMCFMCVLVSESFGLLFGTIFNPVSGTFFGSLFTAYTCLFGGFVILFTHMPKYLYWMSYFCFYRYCYEGLITSIYSYNRAKLDCPENIVYCHLSSPDFILKEMGVSGDIYWFNIGILCFFIVCIRIVTYYSLKQVISAK